MTERATGFVARLKMSEEDIATVSVPEAASLALLV